MAGHAQPILALALKPAVTLTISNLTVGTNYQLLVSSNLMAWTDQGSAFTATNSNEAYPQEFSATNGNQFFRLEAVPSAIFNPVFFDADSGGYYTLAVHGSIGNEFIEIDTTSQTQVTPFSLFDTVSGKFYTVSIVGTAENELPVIMPSTSTLANTIYLFNPDVSAYYSLTVNGTAGNEFLTITKI